MTEINLEYVYTEKVHRDFYEAARQASGLWMACRILWWSVLALFALYCAVLALLAYFDKTFDWLSELSNLIPLGLILGAGVWLIRTFPKRIFQKNPVANTLTQWKITESGMEITSPGSRCAFEWIAFTKIREADSCFLCYTQPYLAWCISKPAFHSPEELELFRSWIRPQQVKFLP